MSRRMIDEGTLNSALKEKQDKLKAGTNITISDDNTISASGGDVVTGQVLLDNITKATSDDGFAYSLAADGKLIIKAAGRYEYKSANILANLHASASTYDVGDTIALQRDYPIANGYFLGMTNTYVSVLPAKADRVDGEPVWEIEVYPTASGHMSIIAKCIKAGTLSEYKNYGDVTIKYTYLSYGNYQ